MLNARSVDQWKAIEQALNECERAVVLFEACQDRLKELLPELSEDVVVDLSNGVISFNSLIPVSDNNEVA